jgi:hypothetical protein
LGVLVGGWELGQALTRRPLRLVPEIGHIIARCAPLLVPLLPTTHWRSSGAGLASGGWFEWRNKLSWVAKMLHDQSEVLDLTTVGCALLAVVAVLGFALVRERRLAIEPHLGFAALALALLFLVMPFRLFGSGYADMRLAPVVAIVTILAMNADRLMIEAISAAGSVALLTSRLTIGAIGFASYDREFTSHLRALDYVAPGSKVAALVGYACHRPWRETRTEHLASLAVVRRDAFVNTAWNIAGAGLLVSKGAPGSEFIGSPSQMVEDLSLCPTDLRPALARRIAAVPRSVFDYVWVFGFVPASLPPYAGLRPLYADGASVLYAVEGTRMFTARSKSIRMPCIK